ncbi:SdrD B-like domain-containing protein, partial [Pseudoalteromonas sp. SS15]|uniref:SdrD B-like domain-containing protein n=1 Tax=Pseudoalteromonas sp. SS15 TaxID=3139393 RepID=UPI003BA8CD2D
MLSKLIKLMLLPLLLLASSVWAVDIQISTFEDIDTTVPRGGEVRYNIEFTNSEEDTAENVVVEFFIPETTNFVSSTSSCQVQAYLDAGKSRNKLRCEMGSIRGRTSGSLQITIITTAATGLTIEPSVRISADNEDPSKLLNNEETQNTSIVAGVDLAVTTLTSDPSDVYLNQTYQYRVQVKNNGPDDAANVVLKHTLPSFAQWSSGGSQTSGWNCSRTNQVITCTRGALSSGQSASLSFASSVTQLGSGVVTASSAISSDTAELDSSNNSKTVNTRLKEHADLAVSVATKIPGYWGIDPNTAHSYEITVRNLGPSKALKPIMTFTLKDGVTFQGVTPANGWSCNRSGQQVSCRATSLDINDSDVIVVRALSPQVKGQYVSTAKIATDSNGGSVDLNSRNNSANGTINVVIPQTLSVSKTIDGGRSSFVSGEQFTFKIAVTNSGDTKELISLEDTLPNQVALISPLSSAVTSDDFNCSVSGQKVTCLPKVASITKDQTKQVQLTVKAVSVGNSIINTATATPKTGDAATGNVSFNIASSAAKLVLQKTANLAWNNKNYMGQTFNYYLQVENTGAGAASNVTLQDTLSDGYTPVSFISQRNVNGTWQTSSDWACSITSPTLNCTASSIAAYTKTRVVLTVKAPFNDKIPRNTFSVGYGSSNHQTSYTGWEFKPINPVKLSVSKAKRAKDTKNTKLVAKGALIESIIKVKNNGEGATQGTLTLEDALKNGEQYVSASGSNWSCTHRDPLANGTGGIVSCVFSNKLQSGTQTNKVTIITRAVAEGTLTNIATAKDVGGSEVSAQKTKSITSSQTADLAISKTVDKTSLSAAENELNYTLTVSNLSGSNITGNDIKISSNTGKAAVLITDDFTATFKSKYDSQATAIRFPSTVISSRGSQFSCQSKETGSFENTKTQILCHLVKNEVFAVGDQVQVPITVARPFVLTNGQVINKASVSSNTHLDLETANNTAQVASNVAAKFDVAVTQLSYAQNPVSTGDNAIMTIELANLGASKASGVELVHTFTKPVANTFTFVSSRFSRSGQSNACSFNSAVNKLTCNIGELASNEAQTVVVTVLPKSASNRMDWRLDGTSVISADNMQFDNLSSNNSKSQALQVKTRTANLKIENNDIDDPLGWYPNPRGFPGSLDNIVVYKVDLEYLTDNDGNTSVASGVGYNFQVTPKGVNQTLKFLCDSSANNTCSVSQARCSNTGQSFTGQTTFNCKGPENSSDSSLEEYELRENTAGNNAIYTRYMFFEVISRPSTTGEVAETLATIFSNEKDNVSANNSEAEKTSIRVAVDLSLTKEASVPQVAVGSEFEYIIKVSNAGPGDSAGNVVYDYLPTYLSLNGAVSTSKGVCTASRATAPSSSQVTDFIRCDIDLIAMNETPIEIRVPVKLNSMPSGEQVLNEAWIETKGFDTNKTNNRNSATTPVVKGIISGKVFFDLQNDGVFSSTTDSGLANIQILLNGNLDAGGSITQKSVMTNRSGEFSFTDLAPGTYTLTQPTQTALNQYLDGKDSRSGEILANSENSDVISNIRLTAGSSSLNHTFAERGAASVSGYVWVDENDNGFKEAEETSGIESVTLTLTGKDVNSKSVTLTTQTNAQGYYQISGFTGGNYRLIETQPTEYNDGLESENGAVIENTRGTDTIMLGSVSNIAKLDNRNFAELLKVQSASLNGRVFIDANENNVFDKAEKGISNIVIQLTGTDHNGTAVDTRVSTDANGTYTFDNLAPSNTGGYLLTQLSQDVLVSNYEDGAESIGASIVAQPKVGDTFNVTISSGDTLLEYNFAELPLSKEGVIAGYVYIDSNDDGVKAADEQPLENVQFTLTGTTISGKTVNNLQVLSDATGRFEFTNLEPSNVAGYTVTQTPPQYYQDGLERFNGTEVAGSRSSDEITKITLTRKQAREDLYFAELIPPTNKKIVAKALLDINQDGTFNGEDTWLQGVNVTLTGTNVFGQQLNITRVTDQNGVVEFTELHPAKVAAQYTLTQAVVAEYADGKDYLNSTEVADHSVDKVVITTLNSTPTVLFTEQPKIGDRQVTGRVFLDTLQDGELEAAELDKALENITVTLAGKDKFGRAVSLTRTTDINGQYTFADLTEANKDGYTVSASFSGNAKNENGKDYLVIGTNRTESNTANSSVKIALSGSNKSATVDFTEKLKPVKYSIAGKVFLDTLQDGELEMAELDEAIKDITVTLTGQDIFGRAVSLSRTTDVNGQYAFEKLVEANADGYTVSAAFSGNAKNENGKDYLLIGTSRIASNTANSAIKVSLSGTNKSAIVDFTEKLKPVKYSIAGKVFLDTLQDGELEMAELDEAIKDITV